MIPYGRQDISQDDIDAVVDVLRSEWITQGPAVPSFEHSVSHYCGASYAVAVNSATSALHVACLTLGLGPGDILWTTPNSFVASANCALYSGASVDFVDIDRRSYNISVHALEEKLKQAKQTGKLPKILIPVHFAGQSSDMLRIRQLADEYGFAVIEDASHAIGGQYFGKPIGGCKYSDITVFSFHPVKIVTSGEGGMALTNREDLYERMQRLRSHGITREIGEMVGDSDGDWYYQQIDLGFNYRITDIQAALGESQMKRLDVFISRRKMLAQRYNTLLEKLPVVLPWQHADTVSAWHLYVVRVRLEEVAKTRKEIFNAMRKAGIGVNVHYIPIHLQPYYRRLGFRLGDFPEAESYYQEAVSLPMFSKLSEDEQNLVIAELENALQ